MTRIVIGDLATGDRIIDVPHKLCRWERRLNRADGLDVSLTLRDPVSKLLQIRSSAAPMKSQVLVIENGYNVGGGPIFDHDYDEDTKQLDLVAEGWPTFLAKRRIIPLSAQNTPLLIQTGENAGEPNPATATTFTGVSWPRMVRGILEQSASWPGGTLPFVFGPDGVGSHDKSYNASDFKDIQSALEDLSNLDGGPDIRFESQLAPSEDRIQVKVSVGDDAKLELSSTSEPLIFDFTAPKKRVRSLKVKVTGRRMAGQWWMTGGRQSSQAIIARAANSKLTDVGYPFMEDLDSSRSTVVLQDTLDSYAQKNLALSGTPREFWTFEARADLSPFVGEYTVGDYILLKTPPTSPYIPAGEYLRRIVALSRDTSTKWVKITTDEAASLG